jgi:hypothetical protein
MFPTDYARMPIDHPKLFIFYRKTVPLFRSVWATVGVYGFSWDIIVDSGDYSIVISPANKIFGFPETIGLHLAVRPI